MVVRRGTHVLACVARFYVDVLELFASAAVEAWLLYTTMKKTGGRLASLARVFGPPWLLGQ